MTNEEIWRVADESGGSLPVFARAIESLTLERAADHLHQKCMKTNVHAAQGNTVVIRQCENAIRALMEKA